MWDHVGPPFSDGILRGSTIFNAFYVKVQSVLRSSARFCKVLPGCVVPTHPVLRVRRIERRFSEVQQIKKSRTQVCQSHMCKENYWTWPPWPFGMRYGCSHHTNCRWATKWLRYTATFTSQPKIPLICIPNWKIMQNRWIPSAVYLRVKTPDGAEQTTNLWIAMQATMFSYKFSSLRWTAMSMVWCHRFVTHLPCALALH